MMVLTPSRKQKPSSLDLLFRIHTSIYHFETPPSLSKNDIHMSYVHIRAEHPDYRIQPLDGFRRDSKWQVIAENRRHHRNIASGGVHSGHGSGKKIFLQISLPLWRSICSAAGNAIFICKAQKRILHRRVQCLQECLPGESGHTLCG